jgi:uncharacterized protein (TIGR00299 family) protein
MKIAYFDCQLGASGDMLLGALIGAGLDKDKWLTELKKIALPAKSFEIKIASVIKGSILSTKVDVLLGENGSSHSHDHSHENHHEHSSHDHEHSHDHKHHNDHDHLTRKLPEVLAIISQSKISDKAKKLAKAIFERLARAEAQVHGTSMDEVHFHEVGAVDAIVDIIGFAIGYDMLAINKSFVSALSIGRGLVKTEHGMFPVPGPAVVYLLNEANVPTLGMDIDFECLTPTGAAILCEIAHSFGNIPEFEKIEGVGYGAGSREGKRWPNVCRLLLGNSPNQENSNGNTSSFAKELIAVIETNIDDMSPQMLAHAIEKFQQMGALDVTLVPALMKKGRLGNILSIFSKLEDKEKLQAAILAETSSLGARSYVVERIIAQREWHSVNLANNQSVRIKIARDNEGKIVNIQPEFEDCVQYAAKNNVSVKEVVTEVLAKFKQTAIR